jgi:dolichol-phosphate mannosyltransferase
MSVLWAAQGFGFAYAQAMAGTTAMTTNYFINNVITYRDKRLRGWKLLGGYLRFCALCAVGLVASVAVGSELNAVLLHAGVPHNVAWPIAGLAGAISGALWNYVSTYLGVW